MSLGWTLHLQSESKVTARIPMSKDPCLFFALFILHLSKDYIMLCPDMQAMHVR